ncbi:MAG TPA: TlpA disulfide reductase family protein [Flavisolibacter sp.]|nr:TlpA disulfide reductase family protein [Flavisolibacter sp.]
MRKPFLLAILCPFLSWAQPTKNCESLRPLTVGDTLPTGVLNPKRQTPNPKLLILDFWATWCSACLRSLPRLDSLQGAFGPGLQFLLVSTVRVGDNAEKVRAFFEKHRSPSGRPYNFHRLLNDTVLDRLFPHNLVPHYVWIRNNRVLAITSFDELTVTNIRAALEGKGLALPLKWEATAYQVQKPLLQEGNGGGAVSLRVRTTLTGYLPGFSPGLRKWSDSVNQKITFLNQSLSALYQYATRLPANHIVPEEAGEAFPPDTARFCFELTVPAGTPEASWRKAMARGLNAAFGLQGSFQKRQVDAWVLVATGDPSTVPVAGKERALPGGFTITGAPLSQLVAAINNAGPAAPIIINEAGNKRYTLTLRSPLTNIGALRQELRPHGLNLLPARREVERFILTPDTAFPAHSPTALPSTNRDKSKENLPFVNKE